MKITDMQGDLVKFNFMRVLDYFWTHMFVVVATTDKSEDKE